jgi:ABC-type Fe3+ transport system permease subunit
MDVFMKVLGGVIAAMFIFFGIQFFFRGAKIIQSAQKMKFGRTAPPRPQEITLGKVIGVLLFLMGLYYLGIVIVSLVNPV